MNLATLTTPALPVLPRLAVSAEAERAQADMLLASAACTQCTTTTEANTLAEVARDIQSYIVAVKKVGLEERRPFNEAAALIKSIEDAHLAPLIADKARLEGLAGAWHAQERARVQREQAERDAELAKLLADKTAAEQLAAEAGTAEGVALADAALNTFESACRAPKPAAHAPGGMATRRVMRVEVLDVKALYAAAPHLVKLEANLAAIKATCFPEHPVAGLRLTWEDQTVTKRW